MRYDQSDFEKRAALRKRFGRLNQVPLRVLAPNLVTLFALAVGLTGIRLAIEGRLEHALYAVVLAILLDGIDGRLARFLKGTSRFGAELDSLADFVNFGVAPGLLLYLWGLNSLGSLGWIGALIFAVATALRLARFNVSIDAPDRPAWAGQFFTGIPAPAGAMVVLLPLYLSLLDMPSSRGFQVGVLIYTLAIAALMVSRVPTWSMKTGGSRVHRDWIAPLLALAALFIALLVSFPWLVLTIGTLAYLASIPFSIRDHRRLERATKASQGEASEDSVPSVQPPPPGETGD